MTGDLSDKSDVTPLALFKFGIQEHLHAFRDRGELYMRKLDYFRRLENDGEVRFDPWEGFDIIGQPGRCKLTFKLPDGQVIEPQFVGPVLMNRGWTPMPHIYCMTVFLDEHARVAQASGQKLLDPRLADFGDHVAIVTDIDEFIRRTVEACRRRGFQYNYGAVLYLPDDHHGEIGPIMKNARYAWQSEFRLTVQGYKEEILRLDVGSLQDIVTIATTKDMLDGIRYELADVKDPPAK